MQTPYEQSDSTLSHGSWEGTSEDSETTPLNKPQALEDLQRETVGGGGEERKRAKTNDRRLRE